MPKWAFGLWFSLVLASCAPAVATRPPPTLLPTNVTPDPNLVLNLSLANKTFRVGEYITAVVVIKNIGVEPLLINQRLRLREYEQSAVVFQILPTTGIPLAFDADVNGPLISPSDFTRLRPGRAFTGTYHLNNYYVFSTEAGGEYTAQAVYHNETEYSRLPVWRGQLYSNIVHFTLNP